jgi:RNA polymerase sigma-70 factor (ECF subfamily)
VTSRPAEPTRDDRELLLAWRAGDRDAGGELIERYHRLLYRFFRNKADDVVEDLVQRTFLVCVERRDEIREGASFRAYLLAVARSEIVRHWREHGRGPARIDPLATSVEDLGMTPSRALAASQEQQRLLLALRRIPLAFQVALELHYWEGATAPELAVVLDVPEGTVRSRLRRGKELLRDELARLGPLATLRDDTLAAVDDWARSVGSPSDE